jgi:hypothetical protein
MPKPIKIIIQTNCAICSKEFETTQYLQSIGKGKFCSQVCYWTSMNGHLRNLGHYKSPEIRAKISASRKGKGLGNKSHTGLPAWNRGKPWSKEAKAKMSAARQGRFMGPEHPRWVSDRSKLSASNRDKQGGQWTEWVKAVFERDGFRCVLCGSTEKLEPDHILPRCAYPELTFNVSNGRTLCHNCHTKTDTYGGRAKRFKKDRLSKEPTKD